MTTTAGQQVVKLMKTGVASGVFIECTKVSEVVSNEMEKISMPYSKASQDVYNPGTLLLDLKKMIHSFSIQGYLSAEQGSGNEGYGDAYTVRNHLIKNIIHGSAQIQLHYRNYVDRDLGNYFADKSQGTSTTYISVGLDKISFDDVSLRADKTISGINIAYVNKYSVQMSLTCGKNR